MVSNSALEIARKAGWDDTVVEIETRVIRLLRRWRRLVI